MKKCLAPDPDEKMVGSGIKHPGSAKLFEAACTLYRHKRHFSTFVMTHEGRTGSE
jgi:hypothetical protein